MLVGILAGGSLTDSVFAECWPSALVGQGELFWAQTLWIHGGIPDDSRNNVVKQALENDYDYVFFMDTDMRFPKASLAKLLRSQAEIAIKWPECASAPTVVGGMYNTRSDHRLNVYTWDTKLDSFMVKPVEPMSGIHKCDFVATGCQLVDVGIFEGLEFPWFEYWYREYGPNKKMGKFSEDAVFAKKCYDIGVPHFVDSDVICSHAHSCMITPVSATEFQVEKMMGEVYNDSIQNWEIPERKEAQK